MTYRYNPETIKNQYNSDYDTNIYGVYNPRICKTYTRDWYIDSTQNIGSPTIGAYERCYINTVYPLFAYNAQYSDQAYIDYCVSEGGGDGPSDLVVMYSSEDCIIIGESRDNRYGSISHLDFSLCATEIILDDYDISLNNNDTVFTKKSGGHGLPLLKGTFTGTIPYVRYPNTRTLVVGTNDSGDYVVDSENTFRCNNNVYDFIISQQPKPYRLYLQPLISTVPNFRGKDDLSLHFLAPEPEVLLNKQRVFHW